jgi:response regulator of citrate/malate metabolism
MKTQNLNIHIVEDDLFYAEIIKEKINSIESVKSRIFNTGQEFLDQLHTNPDIVILDHYLEDYNGLDILREIKGINPNIQVIFLSGQNDMTTAVNTLKYGAFDYLVKNEKELSRLPLVISKIISLNHLSKNNRSIHKIKQWISTTKLFNL